MILKLLVRQFLFNSKFNFVFWVANSHTSMAVTIHFFLHNNKLNKPEPLPISNAFCFVKVSFLIKE